MLTQTIISELKSGLRDGLMTTQDENYEEARNVYNGMIDKQPDMIACCADLADIITCVNFARLLLNKNLYPL